jgi:hypothetical protein
MILFRALLLPLTIALALAPPAVAAQPAAALPPSVAEEIARAAWPDSPCEGRERIEFVSSITRVDEIVADAQAHLDGSCRVEVLDRLSPRRLCVVLMHEFGHLSRGTPDHDGAGGGIMALAARLDDAPSCERMVPPLSIREARAWSRKSGLRARRCRQISYAAVACDLAGRWLSSDRYTIRRSGYGRIGIAGI